MIQEEWQRLYKRLHVHLHYSKHMNLTRTFTTEESKAIASVDVSDSLVKIAFQSNPEKEYTYQCNDNFASSLNDIVNSDTISGLGYLVSTSRKNGNLQEV